MYVSVKHTYLYQKDKRHFMGALRAIKVLMFLCNKFGVSVPPPLLAYLSLFLRGNKICTLLHVITISGIHIFLMKSIV
jgi:hypothetical protein